MTAIGQIDREAAHRLMGWYAVHRRDLPWRRLQDPYGVWVSEIMLQQTRMEVVVPYWERFLARFPTVVDLAAAAEEEVRATWSGLGYYRRAVQLWRAARVVVEEHDGKLPEEIEALRRLPGIGVYTAGAIASIAFDRPEPAIDGNVERVVSRLRGWPGDPRRGEARQRIRSAVRTWLHVGESPGDVNQALMDLGSAVCRPKRPVCSACPLSELCVAKATGRAEEIPAVRAKRAREQRRIVALWVQRAGEVLLEQRAGTAELLPGTWAVPWIEVGDDGENQSVTDLCQQLGGGVSAVREVARLRHTITYRDLEAKLYRGVWAEGSSPARAMRWVRLSALDELPHSSLLKKMVRALASAGGAGGENVPADDLVVDLPQPLGHQPAEGLEKS